LPLDRDQMLTHRASQGLVFFNSIDWYGVDQVAASCVDVA
jgi:hypothetical protein